jgi:hypothetical protein
MLRRIIKKFSEKNSNIEIIKVGDVKNFGKKFSKEEVEKYLDPFGFLDTNDYVQNKPEPSASEEDNIVKKLDEIEKIEDPKLKADMKEKSMPKEYGFKYSGPEPTKFGDWNIKGKCSDF